MFSCNHNGQCCEDPTTQISLTLGDIQRMCTATGKTALQLYKEHIIGVVPFGDPSTHNTFETGIGLFIPCKHRVHEINDGEKTGKIHCSIYENRPLNCRLFPFWILSEAPRDAIRSFVSSHNCGKCCNFCPKTFEEDKKVYTAYKNALVSFFDKELDESENFFKELGLVNTLTTEESFSKVEDEKIISRIINELSKKDFSEAFEKIDEKLKTKQYDTGKALPLLNNFISKK